jgi:hypothetical protein
VAESDLFLVNKTGEAYTEKLIGHSDCRGREVLAIVLGCYLLRSPRNKPLIISDKAMRYIAWILFCFVLFKILSLSSDLFIGNRIFAVSIGDSLVQRLVSKTLVYFGNSHNPVTIAVYVWYVLQVGSVVISWLLRGKVARLLTAIHKRV